MEIYVIAQVQSNVCEVTNKVFIDLNKATKHYESLLKDNKESIEESEQVEEYDLSPENKSITWDDGYYFNLISLETHEVEE